MNEKIEELYAEAKQSTKVGRMNAPMGVVAEQFAELIVKECADFADEHNDYSEGVTLGVGRALKKHFGVEE